MAALVCFQCRPGIAKSVEVAPDAGWDRCRRSCYCTWHAAFPCSQRIKVDLGWEVWCFHSPRRTRQMTWVACHWGCPAHTRAPFGRKAKLHLMVRQYKERLIDRQGAKDFAKLYIEPWIKAEDERIQETTECSLLWITCTLQETICTCSFASALKPFPSLLVIPESMGLCPRPGRRQRCAATVGDHSDWSSQNLLCVMLDVEQFVV